jgi:hypothetical protein
MLVHAISFYSVIYFVQKIMDAEDLFRKLTSGAIFNFKKYTADAQKLKVCVAFGTRLCRVSYLLLIVLILFGTIYTLQGLKPERVSVCSAINIKKELKEDACKLGDDSISSEADEVDDTESELTLLGSMKAAVTGSKIKKKNSKKKLDAQKLLQKKCAAQQEEQVSINIVSGFYRNEILFCLFVTVFEIYHFKLLA